MKRLLLVTTALLALTAAARAGRYLRSTSGSVLNGINVTIDHAAIRVLAVR